MSQGMRTIVRALFIVGLIGAFGSAQQTVAGDWMFTAHERFGPNIMRLSLVVEGEKLKGTGAGTRAIEGTVQGTTLEFKADTLSSKGSLPGR